MTDDLFKTGLNMLKLHNRSLCVIASSKGFDTEDSFLNAIAAVLLGGVDMIIYGEEDKNTKETIKTGRKIKNLCDEFGATLIIKSRADIACAVNADGVYLTAEDIDDETARLILGETAIIGKPFTPDEKADFYIEDINQNPPEINIPIFGYGDITPKNIDTILKNGYKKIALTNKFLHSTAPDKTAREISEKIHLYNS